MTVPDIVALDVGDPDGVFKALIVDEGVIEGVNVELNDFEGVTLAVPPVLKELVGVSVNDAVIVATIDSLSLLELEPVGVELGVLEPVPDADEVGLVDGEVEGVAVADSEAVGEKLAVNDTEGV